MNRKKDRDKRFIQNWRPISLLNVDLKIISKALSKKVKKVLPDLISSQQTTHVKNRHIDESGRLISDVLEIAKIKILEYFLVTMCTEKAFNSLDYNVLISTYGYGKNSILWVKNLTVVYHKVFLTWNRCPSRLLNFSFFIYFSFRDLISSYEIKT